MFIEENFSKRLTELRTQKGVSARDMSLSIGQCESYINNIENRHALPSMAVFFYICEYLGVTPMEFFDTDTPVPQAIAELTRDIKQLNEEQVQLLKAFVKQMK